jgi:hypothetical protein
MMFLMLLYSRYANAKRDPGAVTSTGVVDPFASTPGGGSGGLSNGLVSLASPTTAPIASSSSSSAFSPSTPFSTVPAASSLSSSGGGSGRLVTPVPWFVMKVVRQDIGKGDKS